MKKSLPVLLFLLILMLFLTACIQNETGNNPKKSSLMLHDLGNEGDIRQEKVAYDILDMSDFGFWSLSMKKDRLASKLAEKDFYAFQTNEKAYNLTENPYNNNILDVILPMTLSESEIKNGLLKGLASPLEESTLRGNGITIEKVIIKGTETQNGTDLYEIAVQNYIQMKTGDEALVYDGDAFIRPDYVNSSELNVYPINTYFDARTAAGSNDIDATFEFLKDQNNHEDLLSFIHPNRVAADGTINKPDERDKYRQLGTMGDLNDGHTYNIIKDSANSQTRVTFKRDRLPEKYDETDYWEIQLKDGTSIEFSESAISGIYELYVPYSNTENTEIIKNARFDSVNPVFAGGNGTQDNPYQIETWEHLHKVRDYPDAHFFLNNDLDSDTTGHATYAAATADSDKGWNPIGDSTTPFTGLFDGNGKTISDLRIKRTEADNVGLFAIANEASISNCTLTNATVEGSGTTGGFIGTMSKSTISNITLRETEISGNSDNIGGLIGESVQSEIHGVDVQGTVTSTVSEYIYWIGGVVGVLDASTLTTSRFNGTVSADKFVGVGGLIGNNKSSFVSESYAGGTVSGVTMVGGLIGTINGLGGIIENCYSTANPTAKFISGIAGGFVGSIDSGTIQNCYSTGKPSAGGSGSKGGFSGKNNGGTITDCFWDTQTSEIETTAGTAEGTNTTNMQVTETFTGWDFDTIWTTLDPATGYYSYPYLQNNPQTPAPGKRIDEFDGGSGTEGDPYQILNWHHLNSVRNYLDDMNVYFILNGSLDKDSPYYSQYASSTANENSGWEPIGKAINRFKGKFDGNGKTISDLRINRSETDYVGLFGNTMYASISNLTLSSAIVKGDQNTSSFCGRTNQTTIQNITVDGVQVEGNGSNCGGFTGEIYNSDIQNITLEDVQVEGYGENCGGFAGELNSSEISHIDVQGTITVNGYNNNAGGLAGYAVGSEITLSSFEGTVEAGPGVQRFGGAFGYLESSDASECYSSGTVSTDGTRIGGFVGENKSSTIKNCFSTVDVTSDHHAGGFVGYGYECTTENCYSTGEASGSHGISGFAESGNFPFDANNCFWDTTTSGIATSDEGTGKTSDEMKLADTFTHWDFTNIWDIEEDNSYPYLRNNSQDPIPAP